MISGPKSEGRVGVLGILSTAGMTLLSAKLGIDTDVLMTAIISITGMSGGYMGARTLAKRAEKK